MKVDYFYKTKTPGLLRRELRSSIKQVFALEAMEKGLSFSLIFCDEEEMKRLNQNFRGLTKSTDVLSFSDEEEFSYLGDIFINFPLCLKRSLTQGTKVLEEILFLSVHGYLHLRGFDHDTQIKKRMMGSKEDEFLSKVGLKSLLLSTRNFDDE